MLDGWALAILWLYRQAMGNRLTPPPAPSKHACSSNPLLFADADNPLEIHDPRALWSGGLDVGRKARIQRSRELEANRIEVRARGTVIITYHTPLYIRSICFVQAVHKRGRFPRCADCTAGV